MSWWIELFCKNSSTFSGLCLSVNLMSQLHHISAKCITECKVTVKHQQKKSDSFHLTESARSRTPQAISQSSYRLIWDQSAKSTYGTETCYSVTCCSPPHSLQCVCFLGNMYVNVVQCVYSVWLCVYADTGPLCSPVGWPIRSYSNNQLYFTSLSLSRSLSPYSFTLCDPHPTTTSH